MLPTAHLPALGILESCRLLFGSFCGSRLDLSVAPWGSFQYKTEQAAVLALHGPRQRPCRKLAWDVHESFSSFPFNLQRN